MTFEDQCSSIVFRGFFPPNVDQPVTRQCLRHFASPRLNHRGISGGFGFGSDIQRSFNAAAAGDAGFLAFEPRNLGFQIERAGFQVAGELEWHEQDDLVVVAVSGDFGGRQFFREWPSDIAGGDAGRKLPFDLGGVSRRRRDFSSRYAKPVPSSGPPRPKSYHRLSRGRRTKSAAPACGLRWR